jgi:Domain of unknown function (DUF4129)
MSRPPAIRRTSGAAGAPGSSEPTSDAFDRASTTPACLAALAESGVIFLPLQETVREITGAHTGPLVAGWAFVPMFLVAVWLTTIWRRSAWGTYVLIAAATLVASLQTFVWAHGTPGRMAGVLTLSLLIALRIATLAGRDWREPIAASFGIGAMAALIEVAIAPGATPPWPALIGPVVVTFFVASVASRAASVRLEQTGTQVRAASELRAPGSVIRLAVPCVAALLVLLALMSAGGGGHGVFHWVGLLILGVLAGILITAAFVLSPIAIVLGWIGDRLNLDLFSWLRKRFERFPGFSNIDRNVKGHASTIEVMLEVITFVLVIALLVWLIRRRRRVRLGPIGRPRPAPDVIALQQEVGTEAPRRRFGIRRELPEVTVRRFYAEALLALERRGVRKPDHLTPAEFVPIVGAAFPAVKVSFENLTRAYEDVRYGDRDITLDRVARLRERRSLMLETFRTAARADAPADEDASAAQAPLTRSADGWAS